MIAWAYGRPAAHALLTIPEPVDTARQAEPCPICGTEMQPLGQGGFVCPNGDFEVPPMQLRDPEEQEEAGSEQVQGEGEEKAPPEGNATETAPGKVPPARNKEGTRREVDPEMATKLQHIISRTATPGQYSQETSPADSTAPYGAPISPMGTPTPAAEPSPVSRDTYIEEEGRANVQDLDTSEVTGPPGQSAVSVSILICSLAKAQELAKLVVAPPARLPLPATVDKRPR